jgi:hypothetical protein
MRDIVIDFESYYDDQLSVKRQGAFNYLAQTDVYLVAIVDAHDGYEWVGDPSEVDWTQFAGDRVWSHNLSFDGAFFPAHNLPLPGAQQNCSANLAAWLGAPRALDKAACMLLPDAPAVSKDVRKSMKGRRWSDLSADEQEIVKAYALNDARMACQLVARYASDWPSDEQELSVHTVTMGWEGVGIDRDKQRRYLARLAELQATALKEIPWAQESKEAPLSLLSARKHCERAGIEAPPSFAQQNEDYAVWEAQHRARVPWVAHLSRYRKATLLLARLEAMERRIWAPTGRLTYALKYFGAHTGRWSGDGGNNLQNFRKTDFHGVRLRSLLIPAPGKKLLVADLAQIEPRILHWVCSDEPTLELIRVGGFSFYEAQAKAWGLWDGSPRTLKAANPDLYRTIKALSLGAGYGMGPRRFRAVVAEQLGIVMTPEEARRQLNDYRCRNPRVVAYWNRLDRQLQMSVGGVAEMQIELPNSRHLVYRNLIRRHGDVYATFATPDGHRESKLWGGFLTENVVSAIARDIFAGALQRLIRAGLKVVLHCHDEYVLEVDHDVRKEDVEELLRQPPSWAADLPIDVESWEGDHYAANA